MKNNLGESQVVLPSGTSEGVADGGNVRLGGVRALSALVKCTGAEGLIGKDGNFPLPESRQLAEVFGLERVDCGADGFDAGRDLFGEVWDELDHGEAVVADLSSGLEGLEVFEQFVVDKLLGRKTVEEEKVDIVTLEAL